jgi:hypothetical protein
MEIQDSSAAIYSEAKSEYTKQLVFNLQPVLLRFFLDRFAETKLSSVVTSKAKSALSEFQDSLSLIPEWNIDKVQRETAALLQAIHCDYVEDLITAVFIAHTKILSAIRLHLKPRRKINITVPKPEHFMHRAMSECSRLLWSNVYLFSDSVSSLDRQKNVNDVNKFLEEGILQAIRNLLPVKSILRDSLQDDEDDLIQINSPLPPAEIVEHSSETNKTVAEAPVASETPVAPEATVASETPVAPEATVASETPVASEASKAPEAPLSGPLVIDTERSVGFTGIDSVFGTTGDAELRPSIEDNDEFKILGDLEELNLNEIEELDGPTLTPLGADDYEAL